jgi:enamine deaminase RidA (YjgF/YER057c/UK114 family)
MDGRYLINPSGSPRPVSYYSHGLRVGAMLYSAGQTARDAGGQIVGIGDAGRQAEQAFSNLMRLMGEAKMQITDVVRMNIFIRATADLPVIMAVRNQFLKEHRPALTICVVESLAFPEYLLEVEVISCNEDDGDSQK